MKKFRKPIVAMRLSNHIIFQIVTTFILLHAGVAHALPFGGHLNLCIGSDGHVDVGVDYYTGSFAKPFKGFDVYSENGDHHGNCIDIAIGCAALETNLLRLKSMRFSIVNFQGDQFDSANRLAIEQTDKLSSNSFYYFTILGGAAYQAAHTFQKMTIVLII